MWGVMGIQLTHKFFNPLNFKRELQNKKQQLFKFQWIHVKPWHLGSNWKAKAQMPLPRDGKAPRDTAVSAQRCICSGSSRGLSRLCPPLPRCPLLSPLQHTQPWALPPRLLQHRQGRREDCLCQLHCQKVNEIR